MMISRYLDIEFYNACTDGAREVMVYGWGHCHFTEIQNMLESGFMGDKKNGLTDTKIKLHTCTLGDPSRKPKTFETLDGRTIETIAVQPSLYEDPHGHLCKAGITNLVFENLKRKTLDLAIIPCLFIIDITKNRYPSSSKTILSRDKKLNKLVTHQEIRRCFRIQKLADQSGDGALRDVCEETFVFVKVDIKKGRWCLKRLKAPWQEKKWDKLWKKRMKSKPADKTPKPEELNWQNYFLNFEPDNASS